MLMNNSACIDKKKNVRNMLCRLFYPYIFFMKPHSWCNMGFKIQTFALILQRLINGLYFMCSFFSRTVHNMEG